MLIDFHSHCFPDKIAAGAVVKIGGKAGGLVPHTDGSLDGLTALMKQQNVDRFVVLNIATNEKQMTAVDDAIAVSFGLHS